MPRILTYISKESIKTSSISAWEIHNPCYCMPLLRQPNDYMEKILK